MGGHFLSTNLLKIGMMELSMDLNKINCRARYTSGEGCYEVCLTLILMLNQRVVDFEASDLS